MKHSYPDLYSSGVPYVKDCSDSKRTRITMRYENETAKYEIETAEYEIETAKYECCIYYYSFQ
jgi:hypothetical protein